MNRAFQEQMWLRRAAERDAATDGARERDTGNYTAENVAVEESLRRDPKLMKAVQQANEIISDIQNLIPERLRVSKIASVALGGGGDKEKAEAKLNAKAQQNIKALQKLIATYPDLLDMTGVGLADVDDDVLEFINLNVNSVDFDPNSSFTSL